LENSPLRDKNEVAPVDGNLKNVVSKSKAQLQVVPMALLVGVSEAMVDGASKYGPFNWREGRVEYMQYIGAMMRHIAALIDGEDEADDSHIHHLKHVGATVGILLDAMECNVLVDDRPPAGPAPIMLKKVKDS